MELVVMQPTISRPASASAVAATTFDLSEPLAAAQLSRSMIPLFRKRILRDRRVGSGGLLVAVKGKCRL